MTNSFTQAALRCPTESCSTILSPHRTHPLVLVLDHHGTTTIAAVAPQPQLAFAAPKKRVSRSG